MAKAIFISYRRDDSEGEAGRLFDDLTRAFGSDTVFMDVTGISPGVDFRQAVEDNVASCGVLLAVIGRTWTSITNPAGQRRLEDPADFVALEISSAMKRGVPVIPVLVHEATMPAPDTLPASLKDFAYRNSIELSHARWNSDVQLLITALKPYVHPAGASSAQHTVHATVPVQLPAPHETALHETALHETALHETAPQQTTPRQTNQTSTPAHLASAALAAPHSLSAKAPKTALLIAAAAILLLVLAGVGFFVHKHSGPPPELIGTWKVPGTRTLNSLDALVIGGSGANLTLHAYASCTGAPCDWGTQNGTWDGQKLNATFTPILPTGAPESNRSVIVGVHPDNGNLIVDIENTYKVTSLGQTRLYQLTFVRSN